MATEFQQTAYKQIRLGLELRLAGALKVQREDLPTLSIGEMVSYLFALWGHLDVLGGYGPTAGVLVALIGVDLFWEKPKPAQAEPAMSTAVH